VIDWRRIVGVCAMVGALSGAAAPSFAQEGRAAVRDGNRLYEDGRFQEAHVGLPKRRPELATAGTQAEAPSMRSVGRRGTHSRSHAADVQDFGVRGDGHHSNYV
jgi:hypothetical protein